jgi:hypothetical protein
MMALLKSVQVGDPAIFKNLASQSAQNLQLERLTNDIAAATNELIAYRNTLDREAQEPLDSKTVILQKQLLAEIKQLEFLKASIPHVLPQPIKQTFDRKAQEPRQGRKTKHVRWDSYTTSRQRRSGGTVSRCPGGA